MCYLIWILPFVCGCLNQMPSATAEQKALAAHGGTTIPGHAAEVFFNDAPLNDEQLSAAVPTLIRYGVRKLNLNGRQLTDAALPSLLQLKTLRELNIAGTAITKDGVLNLKELPNLRLLQIGRGAFTSNELLFMRSSLRHVRVEEVPVLD